MIEKKLECHVATDMEGVTRYNIEDRVYELQPNGDLVFLFDLRSDECLRCGEEAWLHEGYCTKCVK